MLAEWMRKGPKRSRQNFDYDLPAAQRSSGQRRKRAVFALCWERPPRPRGALGRQPSSAGPGGPWSPAAGRAVLEGRKCRSRAWEPPTARPRRARRAVGTPSRRPRSPAPARLFTCRGILAESLSLFARGPREGHLGCRVWPVMCGARVTRDMCSLGCSDDGQLPARWGPGSSPLLAPGPGAGATRVHVCKRDGKE